MRKGEATNQAILRAGLSEASQVGLSRLTIGGLATAMEMSKSGLYAHFGSKEQLQVDILDFAADHFRDVVVLPALAEPAGLSRIRTVIERWMGWDGEGEYALPGGCVFAAAATELDDAPEGPVRDRLAEHHAAFQEALRRIHRSAVVVGDLRDTDSADFAHMLYGHMLGFHFAHRMMRDPLARERTWRAIDALLESQRA
ncbi:TetR/AcrR family transcriptional regulator [Agrococcus carbonis]|uniref:DNA-binding transcriptional regulator, AcrR family n=1 Tax=Agrococcus carbonis TaxID=684552 RepID=A0A1H1Q1F0_9MICO|nr:TetR/AcrR family transcriptional regulator [Agrococcus carbonis]SDS17230.1 DNA-binding transcriptional regulator, AcrR family [Agrococcus carbonis]